MPKGTGWKDAEDRTVAVVWWVRGEDQWTPSPVPSSLLLLILFVLFFFSPTSRASSLHVHVKVKHQQLGLLGAIATAHGADQFGVGGPDAPHHAATAAAFQGHQIPDELARLQVPQLDSAVV